MLPFVFWNGIGRKQAVVLGGWLGLVSLGVSACSGDDEKLVQTETKEEMPAERPPAREGPEGCYIPAKTKCDCDIQEADCTEDVGIWTTGCASCAQ